jgi:hypothetical protein
MGYFELDATEKNLVVDYMPSIHKALGSPTQKKRKEERKRGRATFSLPFPICLKADHKFVILTLSTRKDKS